MLECFQNARTQIIREPHQKFSRVLSPHLHTLLLSYLHTATSPFAIKHYSLIIVRLSGLTLSFLCFLLFK